MTITRLCACGCGRPTKPLRKKVSSSSGVRRGEPAKFIQGHFAAARACDPAAVVAAYRSGSSYTEVAETLGISTTTVARHVRNAGAVRPVNERMRRGHGPGRLNWLTPEKVARCYSAGCTIKDLSYEFGVSTKTIRLRLTQSGVVQKLNRRRPSDEDLKRLYCEDELDSYQIAAVLGTHQSTVVKWLAAAHIEARHRSQPRSAMSLGGLWSRFAKHRRPAGPGISKKQRDCLTLLEIAECPLSARRMYEVFSHVSLCPDSRWEGRMEPLSWSDWGPSGISATCRRLRENGFVEAESDRSCRPERLLWFIPFAAERPAATPLSDAERETELAALIESQQDELRRGDWTAEPEKGHWTDQSTDAPLTGTDNFTILDTLGDEDEQLADLMEEYA